MKRLALSAACASAVAIGVTARGEDPVQEPAKLFESLDANKDKTLTSDEVSEERKSFFERIVRIGDKDKDGKVTSEEFVAALSEKEEPVPQPRGEGGERRRGQGRPPGAGNPGGRGELNVEVFKRWDRNGDEKLSREEIPEFARERVGRVFDKFGSDEISFEELTKAFARREERQEEGRPGERPSEDVARGNERRPEGDRRPEDRRPEEGEMRRPEGGPPGPGGRGFGGGFGGRGFTPALLRVLDADENGQLNRDELAKIVDKFGELDRNEDGQLDARELMGFPGGFGGPMGPGGGFGRPQGDRGNDRRPARPEFDRDPGARGPEGQGPDGRGPDGDRRGPGGPPPEGRGPGGDRGPDGPGPGDRGPDGARRGPEGDRPRPDDGQFANADRPRGRDRRGPEGDDGRQQGPGRRGPMGLLGLDRDGDGAISKEEATKQMREKFEKLDGDSDGKVTFEEFHMAIAREYGFDQRPE